MSDLDREQLVGERRPRPSGPLVVGPARYLHQGVVDVHADVEQQQLIRPLRCQTGPQRRSGPQHLDHVPVPLDAPPLVAIDHLRDLRVARRGARSHDVQGRKPPGDLAYPGHEVAQRLDHVRRRDHLAVPRLLPGDRGLALTGDRVVVGPAEHGSLGVEREIDGLHGHAGGLSDVRHRGAAIAALAEQPERGLHDPPFRCAGTRAPRRGVGRGRVDTRHIRGQIIRLRN